MMFEIKNDRCNRIHIPYHYCICISIYLCHVHHCFFYVSDSPRPMVQLVFNEGWFLIVANSLRLSDSMGIVFSLRYILER